MMTPAPPATGYSREVLPDGTVCLTTAHGWFRIRRLRPGVVLVGAGGHDRGQFELAPMDELREDLSRYAPIELFFDASDVFSVGTPATDAWTDFLAANRSALKSVSILVRSRFMHITIEVAKLFSRTGELIRIYLDPQAFEEAIARAAPSSSRLSRDS